MFVGQGIRKTMASIGVLPEFDPKKVRWEEWCQLLDYLVPNKIE